MRAVTGRTAVLPRRTITGGPATAVGTVTGGTSVLVVPHARPSRATGVPGLPPALEALPLTGARGTLLSPGLGRSPVLPLRTVAGGPTATGTAVLALRSVTLGTADPVGAVVGRPVRTAASVARSGRTAVLPLRAVPTGTTATERPATAGLRTSAAGGTTTGGGTPVLPVTPGTVVATGGTTVLVLRAVTGGAPALAATIVT